MNAPAPAPRTRPDAATIADLAQALRALLGDRVTASPAVREQHANQLTWAPCEPPDLVVFPRTTAEVQAVVRACAARDVPIVPYGVGTSLEGHVNAPFGGVSVDTAAMDRVRAVNADDLDCTVEAGVTRRALNAYLRDTGLFFPIDPGADATIGGMAATRASGTNAVRYGTMKDAVLALTAVMPNGDIVTTARRARKSSAGYDLTRLLVGSEGTLGIITEVTLRLHGIPEAISAGICPFPSIKAACDATILTIQSGIPVARIELLDEVQVAACNRYSKLALPETPLLLVEFHGTDAGAREQAERFGEIAAELGGGPFDWATGADERARLWQARHDVYWAAVALRPGPTIKNMSTDVCVPISRLAECVEATKRDIAATGLTAPIAGHVGDGNFHTLPLVDADSPAEMAAVAGFLDRLVARALDLGGTCTGEHGIGQKKMRFMEREHGPEALGLMRTLKRAIDPRNLMNPGKLIP
ncbi:FAD-binding oxidoreductase [Methylobacterium mesophilicum]|uniref:FAD-binding oxidoreductase n=1 Tax=Methylobacterium mesophilicum TaxID=39956 RepID=UPI002F2ED7DD